MVSPISRLLFTVVACSIAANAQFPCKITDYRIPTVSRLYLLCDADTVPQGVTIKDSSLFKVLDESNVWPPLSNKVTKITIVADAWLQIDLSAALEAATDYELQFSGAYASATGSHDFNGKDKVRFRLSTKPQATIIQRQPSGLGITSHLAICRTVGPNCPAPLKDAKLSRKNTAPEKFTDTQVKFEPAGLSDDDPDTVGDIILSEPSPPFQGIFAIKGLNESVFGQPLVVDPAMRAPPIAAPKSKDVAQYYLNFLHQAGVGVTPTWVADVKLAPALGRAPGGFYWAPSLIANVGNGSVGTTKATDLINPSIGVTRLVPMQDGILAGLRFTPSFSYETDRENDKRNALFDGDIRVYLKGLSNTKAERALDAYLKSRAASDAKCPKQACLPQDFTANFGYSVQLYFGAEVGGALEDITATSSDKSSKVLVPSYNIARIRPRLASTIEWKRITISVTATPRYLLTSENVTREVNAPNSTGAVKKKIYLTQVSGFRPYGECAMKFALDPVGHYSLATTYKIGSQPVNFDRANYFQSGLTILF